MGSVDEGSSVDRWLTGSSATVSVRRRRRGRTVWRVMVASLRMRGGRRVAVVVVGLVVAAVVVSAAQWVAVPLLYAGL